MSLPFDNTMPQGEDYTQTKRSIPWRPPLRAYKILTVIMFILCALNIAVIIFCPVMFVYAYKLHSEGRDMQYTKGVIGDVTNTLTNSISGLVRNFGNSSGGFIVGSGNLLYQRFKNNDDTIVSEKDYVNCDE